MENSKERAAVRNQILANGFDALPAQGKRCFVKGWSKVDVTTDWLNRFKRSALYDNTAIRGASIFDKGGLVAIDIDVDDEAHAEALEGLAERMLGNTDWCRFGRGHRRLLLYWTDEAFRRKRSGKYGEFQVEVLSLGSYFVAHGIHPDTGKPYEWTGANPLDNTVEDLPTACEQDVDKFLEVVEEYLAGLGLPLNTGPNCWSTERAA